MVAKRFALIAAAVAFGWCAAPAAADHSITDLLSTGPTGGNAAFDATYKASSADGSVVVFESAEQLVAEDTDASVDLYQRKGGLTTLLSTGASGGNGAFDVRYAGLSEDGSRAFFYTQEQLAPADTDTDFDLYARSATTTTLIPGGNSAASFADSSADGTHVFFTSYEQLVPADTDAETDIYERFAGTTTLVSTGPTDTSGPHYAQLGAVSSSGGRIVFETAEALTSDDTDTDNDVYARSNGVTELLSSGFPPNSAVNPIKFRGASSDARTVAFTTTRTCYQGYYYDCTDIYVNADGAPTRITFDASYAGISKNGQHVFYWSDSADAPGSGDYCGEDPYGDYFFGCPDLFDYSGGTVRTVSTGGVGDCTQYYWPDACFYGYSFGGASADGTHVFFTTNERLANGDSDACLYEESAACGDVYENTEAGGTVLISKVNNWSPTYLGNSDDGSRVFFRTYAREASSDRDGQPDIYERAHNETTQISIGPAGGNDLNSAPTYGGSSTDGTRVFFDTNESFLLSDTDSSSDVYQSSLGTGFPRPKGATPIRASLVPAYQQCTSSNSTHGTPLSFPSCSPPAPASSTVFVGTGDSPTAAPARSVGFVRIQAIVGAAGAPDDSDVSVSTSITNVMHTLDRSDYTGELRLELPVRITDRLSSPGPSATVSDTSLFATVPCAGTADTTTGATCALSSTLDALVPGAVPEGARSIWELGQVKVHDGGPDEDADTTGDNQLFEIQGVFVP